MSELATVDLAGALAVFGAPAALAGALYAAALAALAEAIKRAAARSWRKLSSAEIATLVTGLGALTGPAVWPWIWAMIQPEGAPPDAGAAALLGVGTAGVAHVLYPVLLERALDKIGGRAHSGSEQ